MVAKDSALEMKTQMRGGILGAAKRKLLGGESLFQNTFTATQPGQTLWVAPPAEGDLLAVEMDGRAIMLSSGNYVASGPGVTLDASFAGLKGFFGQGGLFMLKAEGTGPLFMGSYGGIHPVEVGPSGYIVDNFHIVGWTEGLNYNLRRVGGMMSRIGGGEGTICQFAGQGTVWISTRSSSALVDFLHPFRPLQKTQS
jgi:uncharacterized protein (TIGR00266 family)